MVVIKKATDECWEDLSQTQVARLIHVNPKTIYRWKTDTKKVYFRGYVIYLFTKVV